jgi:hypothetical protein
LLDAVEHLLGGNVGHCVSFQNEIDLSCRCSFTA